MAEEESSWRGRGTSLPAWSPPFRGPRLHRNPLVGPKPACWPRARRGAS